MHWFLAQLAKELPRLTVGAPSTIDAYGVEAPYNTIWEFKQVFAVIFWAGFSLLTTFCTFSYWYWFNNSILDLIMFASTAAVTAQHFIIFSITIFSLDAESWRSTYYQSSLIAFMNVLFVGPGVLIASIVHASITPSAYSTNSTSYIVVKNLLFFIYNLIAFFLGLECVFPIYVWWQTLAGLADKVPYNRPSAEEVASSDTTVSFFIDF